MSTPIQTLTAAPHSNREGKKPMVVHHTIFKVDTDLERSSRVKTKPARFREDDVDSDEQARKEARRMMPPPAIAGTLPKRYAFLACDETFKFADSYCYTVGETLALDRARRATQPYSCNLVEQLGPPPSLALSELFGF